MKNLIEYINERGPATTVDNRILKCIEFANSDYHNNTDNVLQWVVDVLERNNEKTSDRLLELDEFNKFRDHDDIVGIVFNDDDVPNKDNEEQNAAWQLVNMFDKGLIFNDKDNLIYDGKNVKIYFQELSKVLIALMLEDDTVYTFFVAKK